jgi:hypothetical protein
MRSAEEKFYAIRDRFIKLDRSYSEKRYALSRKYGSVNDAPYGKRDALSAHQKRMDAVGDQFFALLDEISPRNWRVGVSYYWVLLHLTYADATTGGALSVRPDPGWGTCEATLRELMRPVAVA